jgi:hypothetical protein
MTSLTGDQRGAHRWSISEDSAGLDPLQIGLAATSHRAWVAALRAGHAALLDETITDLAIAVDDELPTLLYSPGRDRSGRLDPAAVERDLAELAGVAPSAIPWNLLRRQSRRSPEHERQ